jgi:hypothetical protein
VYEVAPVTGVQLTLTFCPVWVAVAVGATSGAGLADPDGSGVGDSARAGVRGSERASAAAPMTKVFIEPRYDEGCVEHPRDLGWTGVAAILVRLGPER